jgi:cohesin domain-containing protein
LEGIVSKLSQIAICIAALTLAGSLASAQAVISIDPTTQTTSTGNVVTVDVTISNVSDLYGYQFDLGFNPSVLQAVSSSEGPFLATGGSTFFIPGTNDNLGGTVFATADTLLTAISGLNGSGELAVFTFDAIGAGTSTFAIQNETLLNSSLNVIGDLTKTGFVTVSSPVVAAPEIDPASTVAALSLLLGGLAVLRGRRRTARPLTPCRQ